MTSSKQHKDPVSSRPVTPSSTQTGSAHTGESPLARLEQATRKLFRSTIKSKDRTVYNAVGAVQSGPSGLFVHHDHHSANSHITTSLGNPVSVNPPLAASEPWLHIFLQNVAAPSLQAALPPPGIRLATTAQLAYCNNLVRTHLSPSLAAASVTASLNPDQQASIDTILQSEEEQARIRELTIRVIEEFAVDKLKNSEKIAEVVLLGPALDQEYFRKLLNCFITEFENSMLLDIDILQGLVQLVQYANPDYLQPDDLVRILVILRTRLQDTHQQTAKHPYYLLLALSRLLDIMVEGKVQDLRRDVDHETLSKLLRQLAESSEPYLKHQATYALQGLLHIPNDETSRQYLLRQVGNITMGLLGVASVCKLDLGQFKDGVDHLYKAAGDAHEVGTKIAEGVRALQESGQGIISSVKGGIMLGGRQLWYTALRETQEHLRNGRLAAFNRLVFEAPCRENIEFQWGICQLLGEITIDLHWDIATRQHAVNFLAELYRSDTTWNQKEDINKWILTLIRQISARPDFAISVHAQSLLLGLENEGEVTKQASYRDVMAEPVSPYPLSIRLPASASSPLLALVLAVPGVEYDLHRLRAQRIMELENPLYVPPQAKLNLQASDDTLFPLMEKALEFVVGTGQVLLLLGDSGGGKSTFNLQLERTLWQEYKRGGLIPLHINLPSIDGPEQNMIAKRLQQLDFLTDEIRELKHHRRFIVICDGYDESQLKKNLYVTNLINQPGQWKAKLIVSCRTQYLGMDYRIQFLPTINSYKPVAAGLFQDAFIASFSRAQIWQYVKQYVEHYVQNEVAATFAIPAWNAKVYWAKLASIPNLMDLVKNPFLLTLALRALPKVVGSEQDLTLIRVTRVGLYDNFTEEWLETNKIRLVGSILSPEVQEAFDKLREDDFIQQGLEYQKDLAAAIFQHQYEKPVVEYPHLRESQSWEAPFFSRDIRVTILREASPLTRSGRQFRFLHRSILEYLYSRVISDPLSINQQVACVEPGSKESQESIVNHPLNQRSIVAESSVVKFLAERVEMDESFKVRLLEAITLSKDDVRVGVAAANAMTILVKAGIRFNGANLRGIRIPGADLRGGEFDSADLEGADLSKANLGKTWLRQANLNRTQMTGVKFGELPHLHTGSMVSGCKFSSGGDILVVSTRNHRIFVYNTATWAKDACYPGGPVIAISPRASELAKCSKTNSVELGDILTGKARLTLVGHNDEVTAISYSPDGALIATASKDTTVRIWSTSSGDTLHTLSQHSKSISDVVFSPTELQLVSCSEDMSIITWDALTGEALRVDSLNSVVRCLAYSPDGGQFASGYNVGYVNIRDTHTGETLYGIQGCHWLVDGVVYSPDGHQIAFCSELGSLRVWDYRNGDCMNTLSDQAFQVGSVAYSPNGKYIVSGRRDGYVQLWTVGDGLEDAYSDTSLSSIFFACLSPNGEQVVSGHADGSIELRETLTAKPLAVLKGHANAIRKIAYSPCGQRIASTSLDCTVRLWCIRTGESLRVFEEHTGSVDAVAFSPDGSKVVSGSADKTVRIWDRQTGETEQKLEGHSEGVEGVAYSASGLQIASSSPDNTTIVWCSQTGQQFFRLNHSRPVLRIMYAPEGEELCSLTVHDDAVHFWNSHTGERADSITSGMAVAFTCFSFSPSGCHIAAVGADGVLRIWFRRAHGWELVLQSMVRFTLYLDWKEGSDGTYISTAGLGMLRTWKLSRIGDGFSLQLLWGIQNQDLSLTDAKTDGIEGLSPVNHQFMMQRVALFANVGDEDEREEEEEFDYERYSDWITYDEDENDSWHRRWYERDENDFWHRRRYERDVDDFWHRRRHERDVNDFSRRRWYEKDENDYSRRKWYEEDEMTTRFGSRTRRMR